MIVEAPDGKTIDFGELPHDQIAAAMRGMYPASEGEGEGSGEQTRPIRGTATDLAAQAVQGATFGLGDEATAGIVALRDAWDRGSLSGIGKTYDEALAIERGAQKRFSDENPKAAIAAQLAGGLATGAGGAVTKAGTALGHSLRTGNLAARVGKSAAAGAASGAAYGFGSGEGGTKERLESAGAGAALGGVAGGALPAAGAAARKIGQVAVPEIEQGTAALAQRAKDFGIPLRLDQISPTRVRKTVQKVSQELPLSGADAFEKTQRQAFTRAVAKTIGQDSVDLGPDVIQAFRKDVGARFDNVLKGETIAIGDDVAAALEDAARQAGETLDNGLAEVVRKNADSVARQLSGGEVNGELLASIRSELLKKSTRADNAVSPYLGDMIEVLDKAAARALSPEKVRQLADARRQWRNFRTIQPLLENATDGTINPTQLLNRVASSRYIDASKTPVGADDLVDLARIGKQFLPKAGGSDTTQKMLAAGGLGGLGTLAFTNPLVALGVGAKAGAVLAANKAFQKANALPSLVEKAVVKSLRKGSRAPGKAAGIAALSGTQTAGQFPAINR